MKLFNFLLVAMLFCTANAKEIKRPQTYNYQKALEAYDMSDYDNAIYYFRAELNEDKKNGYAWAYLGRIFVVNSETADALTACEQALKCLPKKDNIYISWNYQTMGMSHLQLGDSLQALNDYSQAMKANDKEPSYYFNHAILASELNLNDEAEKDMKALLKYDPNNANGLIYLGWLYSVQNKDEEAVSCYERAIKLDPQNSRAYATRSVLYHKLGNDRLSMDDFISSLQIDIEEDYAIETFLEIMRSNPSLATSKLKVEALRENKPIWSYMLGYGYYFIEEYENAIEWFNKCSQLTTASTLDYYMSMSYNRLGDYYNALNHIQNAIEQNGEDYRYYALSSEIKCKLGHSEDALNDISSAIRMNPDAAFYYESRANIYMEQQMWKNAAEDYGMTIALFPYDADLYVSRGLALHYSGKTHEAENDFNMAVQMDRDTLCLWAPSKLFYAYHFLGDDDNAKSSFNKMLNDSTDSETFYEGACLFALMGEKGEAINYLRQALDAGYDNFNHIEKDKNLENIRSLNAFDTLVKQYKDKFMQDKSSEKELWQLVTTEVPFIREDGVCKVKCSINGLPLSFVFDTGAADVSISNVEATFMLKNGYLNKEDIGGSQTYLNASGEINIGTIINIKSVVVGDVELKNVKASVTDSNSAPLLLGQSVFKQIGNIEIDNDKRVFRLSYRKPVK